MKTKKANNEKKKPEKANRFSHCGDFQKMAEMMKTFCQGEGDVCDCASFMRRMTGQGNEAGAEETKRTQKQPEGGGNG